MFRIFFSLKCSLVNPEWFLYDITPGFVKLPTQALFYYNLTLIQSFWCPVRDSCTIYASHPLVFHQFLNTELLYCHTLPCHHHAGVAASLTLALHPNNVWLTVVLWSETVPSGSTGFK